MGVKIVTVTGSSGSGKTTVVRKLLEHNPKWRLIPSVTSRDKRNSDLPGEYKYRVPRASFSFMDGMGRFAWIEEIHGNLYGTLVQDVTLALMSPNLSFMMLTPGGVVKLHKSVPVDLLLSFFLVPPSEDELRRRLAGSGRKESSEAVERRIRDCRMWHDEATKSGVPYIFVRNDSLINTTVATIQRIIKASL